MTYQLFLRTTDKDGKAYNGFQWPMEVGATVTAPDWKPTVDCGNGLHGLLAFAGDRAALLEAVGAREVNRVEWLAAEYAAEAGPSDYGYDDGYEWRAAK